MSHESTRSICIYFEIFFKWSCVRICHKGIGIARGAKGPCSPPKYLENIVILCFERRFSKQNSVIRPKSSIFRPQNFLAPTIYLGWLRHCKKVYFLSSILLNWRIFTQLSLKWTWTINKYVSGSLIRLCWLNRTHFGNILSELFSTLRVSQMLFFHKLSNIHFWEHFLQLSHNLIIVNDQISISGEKPWKLDTLAKLFQTMRNGSVPWHDYWTIYIVW